VTELVPNVGADDPVVETVVGNNMNGANRHGLSFMTRAFRNFRD
jgi:hypothetical protein